MVSKQELLNEVVEILSALSKQLDTSEVAFGWNEELRAKWLSFFIRLGKVLVNNELIPPEFSSIGCSLDSFGITDGLIFNRAMHISILVGKYERTLRKLKNQRLFSSMLVIVITAFLVLLPYIANIKHLNHYWILTGLAFLIVLLYWIWFAIILKRTLSVSKNAITELNSFRNCMQCKRKITDKERALTIQNELGGTEFWCMQCYAHSKM